MSDLWSGTVVAVTGGAGLIGSFLACQLVRVGANVIVIDDFSKGQRENLILIRDKIEIREGDLEDPVFASKAFESCDIIFHLASRAYGIGYSKHNHLNILQHNERITNNLLDTLKAKPPNIS